MNDPYDLMPEVAALVEDDRWEEAVPVTFNDRVFTVEHLDTDTRCEQLLRAIRNIDTRRACLMAEIDRLKAKLNAADNRRDEVRKYLQSVMVLAGVRKVRTPIATASISAGRERIVLDEEHIEDCIADWPDDVVTKAVTFPPPKVSKTALANLPDEVLRDLSGVSRECGEDYLTIK